jgi:nucleotide-binding universal stress UspA family protein
VALAPNGLRLNHAPQVQRLVVAFASGSEGGAILRRGVDFARRMRVPLDVMTLLVRHRVFGSALGADAEAEVLQQSREDLLEAQQRTLQGLDHADLTVRQHVVVGDSVDSALHQMTWDVGDLLLVPSSRGTVQRVLLGDVNYRIVRATPVATLVLPRQTG